MKKRIALVLIIVMVSAVLGFVIIKQNEIQTLASSNEAFLRLHIRANSNSEADQTVKYKVKARVVDYLTPIVADCKTVGEAKHKLEENLDAISFVATSCLIENGFYYGANAKINNEYFPTRAYNETVLDEGFYDALIIELGQGVGNNWWCVVYPPLCFIGAENSGTNGIFYKSKIVEILKQYNIF